MVLPTVRKRRWTRTDFDRLVEAGGFGEDERIELLDGELWELSPPGARHVAAARLVERELQNAFGQGFDVRRECPFALDDSSQPQPDVCVVEGGIRDYVEAHPRVTFLLVEVSDATLSFDQGSKLAAYARNGIPEYWILDLKAERLQVHQDPRGDDYGSKVTVVRGDVVRPMNAPDAQIAIVDLLP